MNQKIVDKLNYEEAYAELETIVAALEEGNQTLEEATKTYMRGQELLKHCARLLEKVDLRIRQLNGDEITDYKESV